MFITMKFTEIALSFNKVGDPWSTILCHTELNVKKYVIEFPLPKHLHMIVQDFTLYSSNFWLFS